LRKGSSSLFTFSAYEFLSLAKLDSLSETLKIHHYAKLSLRINLGHVGNVHLLKEEILPGEIFEEPVGLDVLCSVL
jgi:hypothetical protein